MKKILLLITVLLITQLSISQNALRFDGTNDKVQTTYAGVLGTTNRTFEAWIYLYATPTGNKCIMDYGRNAVYGRNTFGVNANRSLVYLSGGNNIASNTSVVPVGAWTHVAFVFNSGTGYFYVNGVQVGTGPLPLVNTPSGWDNYRIGERVSGGTIPFSGRIDEVRIWNVARTQTEIASTMNTEFCAAPTSLKAYYKLNQGTAGGTNTTVTSATDDAGTNNGTLTNFALTGATSNWVTGKSIFPVALDSTYSISACGSYTMPDGTLVTTPGTYYDTISSSASCDSLNSYVVSFVPAIIQNSISDSGCVSYTTPLGKVITSSGTYYDTISTSVSCDTTIEYNIVISGAVDDSIYRVGGRMTSFDTWASQQWVRCDSNYKPIVGATTYFYIATLPGDYAVIVTRGSCVDTSDCININPASINENSINDLFEIYPNPASSVLNINNIENRNITSISIIDITGKISLNKSNLVSKKLNIESLENGVYFLKIETKDGIATIKFVKA
ncbi:T9SS type A sorting domain-containing protein [Flavobacteriales bacterium]|nr:T9SS type A sorting domain-containing protein [Flavobacteriales bacterium]